MTHKHRNIPGITTDIGMELRCMRSSMTRTTSCIRCITSYICRNSTLTYCIHTRLIRLTNRIHTLHTRLIKYIHPAAFQEDINSGSAWTDG
jgi:hypothetical protein